MDPEELVPEEVGLVAVCPVGFEVDVAVETPPEFWLPVELVGLKVDAPPDTVPVPEVVPVLVPAAYKLVVLLKKGIQK